VLGVLLKLGVFPLIVWIPILLSSLDWFSFFFLMVLKKIPLFYLVYSLASGKKFVWIFLITILQGVLGLFFSKNNFKIFLCWSSVIKRSLICLVFLINPFYGWVYFFFYGILMFLICYKSSARNKDFSFLKTWKNSNLSKRKILITKFFLLILAGFPPFFGFLKKFFFINSFKMLKFFEEILKFEFFTKNYFFLIFLSFLILLKVCAYIKFFIQKILYILNNRFFFRFLKNFIIFFLSFRILNVFFLLRW